MDALDGDDEASVGGCCDGLCVGHGVEASLQTSFRGVDLGRCVLAYV